MTNQIIDFESVRSASKNGKRPYLKRVGDVVCKIATRRDERYRAAEINIDLYPGSHELTTDAIAALKEEYAGYLVQAAPRSNRISDVHSHFSRSSIWFAVRGEDAGRWFTRIVEKLVDGTCVQRMEM